VLTYAIVGLGVFVTALLGALLGGDASQIVNTNNELFSSARGALSSLVRFGPLAGAVLGIYYYRTDTTMQSPAKAAGIAAAAGILAISVLLLLFMILFDPSGGNSAGAAASLQGPTAGVEAGDEIPAVLGITVGTALAAAGTGFLLEEDPLDIF
jgi:hypothetical protein